MGVLRPRDPLLVVPLVLAISGLQLRHSLAAARGQRPAYWQWSFLALLVLAYVPLLWMHLAVGDGAVVRGGVRTHVAAAARLSTWQSLSPPSAWALRRRPGPS